MKKAFTFTEILVSLVLIVIVSAASWTAVSVLTPTSEATRYRIKAENLLTKSQEEVRRVAQSLFDELNNCKFDEANTCGFTDIAAEFPEYTRTLTVSSEGSPDFKRVHIAVSWLEEGENKVLDSVVLLAKPAEPSPANIIGLVQGEDALGVPLPNVKIDLAGANGGNSSTTSSATLLPRTDGKQINYTFADPDGRKVLSPGTWILTVTDVDGYYDLDPPITLTLETKEERDQPIILKPKPENGHIIVTLTRPGADLFNNQSEIGLYQKGERKDFKVGQSGVPGGLRTFDFVVKFEDTEPQCFTVATVRSYLSAMAGDPSCSGFDFDAEGWSSAQNGVDCSKPRQGSASDDTICVSPGEEVAVPIPLVYIPITTIKGIVADHNGPIPNAEIWLWWHAPPGQEWPWDHHPGDPSRYHGTSDAEGKYEVVVPAEQDMFPSTEDFYLRMEVQAEVQVNHCCGETILKKFMTGQFRVGPLHKEQPFLRDVSLDTNVPEPDCGNANGRVVNDKTSGHVPGASVRVVVDGTANEGGNYRFQCDNASQGFRVPAGPTFISAQHPDYYPFPTGAEPNWFYPSGIPVSITGQVQNDMPPIALWPKGFGSIKGRVYAGSVPISWVQEVIVQFGTGEPSVAAYTDTNGFYEIQNVPATWPPPDPKVIGNPKYNQGQREHWLHVYESGAFEEYWSPSSFRVIDGQETNGDIYLVPRGAS